jgi:hypothetical protein
VHRVFARPKAGDHGQGGDPNGCVESMNGS